MRGRSPARGQIGTHSWILRVTHGTDRDNSAGPELIANETRIRTYKAMARLEVHIIRCIWSLASRTTPVSRLASSRVVCGR